jgi:tetratricopeptide (TPR) repeat protein
VSTRKAIAVRAAMLTLTISGLSLGGAGRSGAGPTGVVQEALDVVFADSARVDSLRSRVSPERVEEYRRRAADDDDPRRWYDLGAVLLLAGDWEGALEPLERAVARTDSDVDAPASYNLGVAHGVGSRPSDSPVVRGLPAAEATAAARRAGLVRARDAFRRVLREDPGAEDARWNLEVVDRWLRRLGGDGGGGDGGGSGGDGGDGGDAPREMTPEEVRRLLDAAASEERRVQEERFQRSRSRDPVAERNW